MRILSMTATFGSLDAKKITFVPGLNVICAPNEWGKSTWCAFLMAMFYGIDTRQRSRSGALADKERYKPWSGKPMGGSIDLLWQGRAVTIERYTQGRVPMGAFRAYETDSGLEVMELTGENCGLMLLGVERSVFARSGFISAENMAVTQDEDLLRRLNRLVTTGDDSPQVIALEGKLRDLKNKCRYNQSGALPQAKQELARCQRELERQRSLEQQAEALRRELTQWRQRQKELNAHAQAQRTRENREKLTRLEDARQAEESAKATLLQAAEQCRDLPSMAQTARGIDELKRLRRERAALELEWAARPPSEEPEPPECFLGLEPERAMEKARSHVTRRDSLRAEARRRRGSYGYILAGYTLVVAGVCGFLLLPTGRLWWIILFLLGEALTVFGVVRKGYRRKHLSTLDKWDAHLRELYGEEDPVDLAERYAEEVRRFRQREQDRARSYTQRREMAEHREREMDEASLKAAQDSWNAWADAQRIYIRARGHRRALEAMVAGVDLSTGAVDTELNLTTEETKLELEKVDKTCAELSSRLDTCLGQLQALPSVEELELERQTIDRRIQELEQWYSAAVCALEMLGQARRELQSRFAPRISREAGYILKKLTGGRYDSLFLDQDFGLRSKAEGEATVRESAWRSLGTREQMALAVRLAVSKVMIPGSPVILDDALGRFDDERMAAALAYLEEQGEQVILFSCQNRERIWMEERQKVRNS